MLSPRSLLFFSFFIATLFSAVSANLLLWQRQDGPGDLISSVLGGTSDTTTSASDTSATTSPTTTSTPTSTSDTSTTTSSASVTSTTPTTSATTQEVTSTIITSDVNGTPSTRVVLQTTVVSNTQTSRTSQTSATATPTGGLATDNNASPSGGISPQGKNIAIGVGVGVGGAILLGAVAVVAWRMWGRKKRNSADEDHFLMNEPTSEKPPTPSASPFKSTLDQYHNPAAGRLNTASNF